MHLDMHQALRCHARSKRSRLKCQAPAVQGLVFAESTSRRAAIEYLVKFDGHTDYLPTLLRSSILRSPLLAG